jgi:hypothetical protein
LENGCSKQFANFEKFNFKRMGLGGKARWAAQGLNGPEKEKENGPGQWGISRWREIKKRKTGEGPVAGPGCMRTWPMQRTHGTRESSLSLEQARARERRWPGDSPAASSGRRRRQDGLVAGRGRAGKVRRCSSSSAASSRRRRPCSSSRSGGVGVCLRRPWAAGRGW